MQPCARTVLLLESIGCVSLRLACLSKARSSTIAVPHYMNISDLVSIGQVWGEERMHVPGRGNFPRGHR